MRAEPKGGHDGSRLLSKGPFMFKPDSFVLKYEVILSLWPEEPLYGKCKGNTRSLNHSSVARSGTVISVCIFLTQLESVSNVTSG